MHFSMFFTRRSLSIPLSLFFATIATLLCKIIFARYRPDMLNNDLYGFSFFSLKHNQHSFPSGHTALSCSGLMAIAYTINYHKVMHYAVMLIVIIAASRIFLQQHFLSDIIMAIYIGIFSFYWAKVTIDYLCTRTQKR